MPPTWYTPQQLMEGRQYVWQKLETTKNCVLKDIPEDQLISYFNRPRRRTTKSQYDLMFHFEEGWDQSMWRSDRMNPRYIRDAVHVEESKRTVPILTSSNYGKRKTDLEGKSLFNHKRSISSGEFYRVNGVNMKPSHGLLKDLTTAL